MQHYSQIFGKWTKAKQRKKNKLLIIREFHKARH